jgi:hypothetical protein
MTPSIDMYHVMESHLGERFLRYQYRSSKSPLELATAAIYNSGDEAHLKAELRAAYAQCNRMVKMRMVSGGPYAGPKTKALCARLAVLSAQARTSVIRNPYEGHGVVLTPEAEATPRVAKMLWLTAQALCILRGEDELSNTDLLVKIALDNVRNPRRQFFLHMMRANSAGTPMLTAAELVDAANLTRQTAAKHVEDLVFVGCFEKVPKDEAPPHLSSGRPPVYYRFTPDMQTILQNLSP